jgi:hypothetical protein
MHKAHITRKVRAGRPAPTDLPPLQVFDTASANAIKNRHLKALAPWAFLVAVVLICCATVLVIVGGAP